MDDLCVNFLLRQEHIQHLTKVFDQCHIYHICEVQIYCLHLPIKVALLSNILLIHPKYTNDWYIKNTSEWQLFNIVQRGECSTAKRSQRPVSICRLFTVNATRNSTTRLEDFLSTHTAPRNKRNCRSCTTILFDRFDRPTGGARRKLV